MTPCDLMLCCAICVYAVLCCPVMQWGAIERSPGVYSWNGYKQLFEVVRAVGLKLQVVLSFHACGGNVGDMAQVPLPPWVLQVRDCGGFGRGSGKGLLGYFGGVKEGLLWIAQSVSLQDIHTYRNNIQSFCARRGGGGVQVPLPPRGLQVRDCLFSFGWGGSQVCQTELG
jgi:hypothetical protein